MSVLEDLYYGNINVNERNIMQGSEYYKLGKDVIENQKKLYETINNEQKEIYESIINLISNQECILLEEIFEEGFCLGVRMMLEVLEK